MFPTGQSVRGEETHQVPHEDTETQTSGVFCGDLVSTITLVALAAITAVIAFSILSASLALVVTVISIGGEYALINKFCQNPSTTARVSAARPAPPAERRRHGQRDVVHVTIGASTARQASTHDRAAFEGTTARVRHHSVVVEPPSLRRAEPLIPSHLAQQHRRSEPAARLEAEAAAGMGRRAETPPQQKSPWFDVERHVFSDRRQYLEGMMQAPPSDLRATPQQTARPTRRAEFPGQPQPHQAETRFTPPEPSPARTDRRRFPEQQQAPLPTMIEPDIMPAERPAFPGQPQVRGPGGPPPATDRRFPEVFSRGGGAPGNPTGRR